MRALLVIVPLVLGCSTTPRAQGDAGGSAADAGGPAPDAGLCASCPPGARCTESTGCAFVCQACTADTACPGGECRQVTTGFVDGFCARRLASCDAGTPTRVDLVFTPYWCGPIGLCVFESTWERAADSLASSVTWSSDGGVQHASLAPVADAGLMSPWDLGHAGCLRQADFSIFDDCLTHQPQLAVTVFDGVTSTRFEYYAGSGVQPPLEVEQALAATVRVLREQARDAGFSF